MIEAKITIQDMGHGKVRVSMDAALGGAPESEQKMAHDVREAIGSMLASKHQMMKVTEGGRTNDPN